MPETIRSDYSRVFLTKYRAGPSHAPVYEGQWRAGALAWGQGDVTTIYEPDSTQYAAFKAIGKVPGEPSSPTLAVAARYTFQRSELLKLVKQGCDHDLQVHFGKCYNPMDFDGGWEKITVIEAARLSDYGTDDLGALEPANRAAVLENVTFTGEDAYEIMRQTFAEMAATNVGREVMDIAVCDSVTCGLCGLPSDGCQVVFALTGVLDSSLGLTSKVIYTDDAFSNSGVSEITGMAANEEGNALACAGSNLIVISNAVAALFYCDATDLLNAAPTWAKVTTGFVGSNYPRALVSLGPSLTWIVGVGGYIYFCSKPGDGVTVQSAGGVTVQNLNAIDAYDINNLLTVGASNTVLYTRNGGSTWVSVTGPAVGVALNCCDMKGENEWWVGTAGGKLYYTIDAGVNWIEKGFSGSGAGAVTDIKFVNGSVGYMTHNTATPVGRIFRTINGGYTWYIAPEGSSTIPTNAGLGTVAVCGDPNIMWAGGVTAASDGVLIAGS